jgi:hypothetical protein
MSGKTKTPDDELFPLLVAAFTAGEQLGQDNSREIDWTSNEVENVESAAPKYAAEILGYKTPTLISKPK